MDMNAPIIIIPERYAYSRGVLGLYLLLFSVATHECTHLLIDAGHIAIHSELADKDAKREIHAKRKQQYTDEDYKRLESLMYDKIMLRLEAAQVRLVQFLSPAHTQKSFASSSSATIWNPARRRSPRTTTPYIS